MAQTRQRAEFFCSPAQEGGGASTCAWNGCTNEGSFRAPKDRRLSEYYLLCLEHVRAYNAGWDFHAGLSPRELEMEIRSASTWDRPTWKLGTLGPGFRRTKVNDPFGFAEHTAFEDKSKRREERRQENATPGGASARLKAMKIFELDGPLTLETLKRRYKDLVKKHHPDANGGSAAAESRMKVINQAYQTLRASLAAVG